MFPVTALEFIIVKCSQNVDMTFLYRTYFPVWLITTLFFIFKNNIGFTNRWTLISGGILALWIPVVNGIMSGNWLWEAYRNGHEQVMLVDLLWLILGLVALWIAFFKLGKSKSKIATNDV